MGVEHDSLDVGHVRVALEGPTIEPDLFAHLGDLLSVVLGEEVELEDSLSDVRSAHEVDLKDFRLQMPLVGSVVLEGLEEEGGALLHLVELQKDGDNLIDLSLWWALISVRHHSREADSRLRIDGHDLSQDLDEIWSVAGLLAVWHDLVQLVGLDESLNHLLWRAGLLVDAEGHLWVGGSDEVSQLVSHGQFLLLDPILDQVELVLLDDRSCELDGLDGVQLGGLQESVEVDEDRGRSSSGWQVLELVDGLLVSQ